MDIVFRRIPFNSPRTAPAGELHVRALDAKHDTALAKLALNGRGGFVGGDEPNPRTLVVTEEPTLDDMLAVLFLQHGVADSPAAQDFARYVSSVRQGLSPTRAGGPMPIPIERSLEAVYRALRHNAVEGATKTGTSLTNDDCRVRFLADWERLATLIRKKIAAGVDPHRQPLFDDTSAFDHELNFLNQDHAVYRRERDAGERLLIQVSPGAPHVPSLFVKQRSSYLFVPFARSDPEAPDGRKFHLLGVKDPEQGWIISTDPVDRYNLKSLADRLQDAENAATPKGESPHVWRDGAPHKHTIIFPPETGSRLSDDAVVGAIKKWGNAKPVSKQMAAGLLSSPPIQSRPRWPLALIGLTVVICAAIVFFPRGSPSSSSTDKPEKIDPRIELFARGDNNQPVAETMKLGQKLLPRGEEPRLHAGSPTEATFVLTNPGGQKRSIQVWLEYTHVKEVPPPDNVVLRTSAGRSIPVAGWTKAESIIWKSPEVRQIEIEGEKPTLSVAVSSYSGADRDLGMQLCWRPDFDLHLYFLAIGIGKYGKLAGVQNLECPAGDARDLTDAIRKNCRHLFNKIDCPDPLIDDKATRGDIIEALDEMYARITADPAKLKLAVVFFAGHGIICKPQYFAFLPHDYVSGKTANVISADEINKRLGELNCPAVLILDACHSGQAALDIFLKGSRASVNNKDLEDAVESFEKERPGLFVLTACQSDELAFENKSVWGHGALCKALLEKLDGSSGAQPGGIVTLKDLNEYTATRVRELTKKATGAKSTVVPAFPAARRPESIPLAYFPGK